MTDDTYKVGFTVTSDDHLWALGVLFACCIVYGLTWIAVYRLVT